MTSPILRARSLAALLGALALVVLSGCTETNTEYVERPQFNPPPDSVSGFMGYYTASTKQTTCGNCHSGYQGQWIDTHHADAYQSVVATGNTSAYCFGCHTVTASGNSAAVGPDSLTAGYDAVQSEAYHDVQCESCHGPGYEHVSNPNTMNRPYARAGIYGMNGTTKDTAASCGGCHSGEHAPFVEQWATTGHADSAANAYPAGTTEVPGCGASCHEGRTALARFNGEPSHYVEKDSVGQITTLPPATCAVCHDPHGSPYEGQLRAPIDVPDVTVNLCMSCHNKSTTPASDFSNSTATVTKRGSHAAQGPILLGTGAGYIPRNFAYDTNAVYTTHASINNPRLCAGCHVNSFTVTDAVTGDFVLESVGHLFSPDPCLDADGVPVIDDSCDYLPSTTRSWTGCLAAGCHASANVAASALVNERALVANLADQLWNDLNPTLNTGGEPYMDAADDGYLPDLLFRGVGGNNPIVDGVQAFNASDNIVSPAEGALWNAMMFAEDLYDHNDGSFGVHNPFYYEALLAASIAEVIDVYGAFLPAPPSPTVKALMDKALSRKGVRYTSGKSKLSAAR
jgi:predicted CXXCH cytochrome family protein